MEIYTSGPPTRRTTDRIKVGIADFAVGDRESTLSTSGLGSCVGVALYDDRVGVAGLAHAMLPHGEGKSDEAKYVDTAVGALVEAMEREGASRRRLVAKLAGGSTMFEFKSTDESVGDRNVDAARATLAALAVPVEAEDVGGDHGRSLELDGATGTLHVRSASAGQQML
ncbi:chemotaxis protein CheD [Salinigranum halophilum]|uniref:chemotaxis protein CheD n=1 Tax=Salinigranum halophilum TaxID=2565931 RepID=UPI00115CB07C|nr:chemotaxis protein CheD [Salinigranum halophilum]